MKTEDNITSKRHGLMTKLANLYQQHTKEDLDYHEPGSDPDCLICEQITNLSTKIQSLESKNTKSIGPVSKNIAPKKKEKRKAYTYLGSKLFIVTSTDTKYIFRTKNKLNIKRIFNVFGLDVLDIEQIELSHYESLMVATAARTFTNIKNIINNDPEITGVIAKYRPIARPGNLSIDIRPKTDFTAIQYIADQKDSIINFVTPCKVTEGKKKNKLNIMTKDGYVGIAPSDWLVKITENKIISLTESERSLVFDTIGEYSWVIDEQVSQK